MEAVCRPPAVLSGGRRDCAGWISGRGMAGSRLYETAALGFIDLLARCCSQFDDSVFCPAGNGADRRGGGFCLRDGCDRYCDAAADRTFGPRIVNGGFFAAAFANATARQGSRSICCSCVRIGRRRNGRLCAGWRGAERYDAVFRRGRFATECRCFVLRNYFPADGTAWPFVRSRRYGAA